MRSLFFSSLVAVGGFVLAASPSLAAAAAPSSEVEACLRAAAAKHRIAAELLFAIAETESGFNPNAVRRPFTAGGDATTDYGLMQINSGWLPVLRRHGVAQHHLFNPCVSADVGGWILADNFRRLGVTWDAVGAYNAKTPWKRVRYSTEVYGKLQKHISGSAVSTRPRSGPRVAVQFEAAPSPTTPTVRIGSWESTND